MHFLPIDARQPADLNSVGRAMKTQERHFLQEKGLISGIALACCSRFPPRAAQPIANCLIAPQSSQQMPFEE